MIKIPFLALFAGADDVMNAMAYVTRGLAILGGAVFGAIVSVLFGQLLARAFTRKKMPAWMSRVVGLGGAIVTGWIVGILVSGKGGFGFGSGDGFGGAGGTGSTAAAQGTGSKKRTDVKPPIPGIPKGEVVEVEVVQAADDEKTKWYRVPDGKDRSALTLEEVKEYLKKLKEKKEKLRVDIILYQGSPDPGNPIVKNLKVALADLDIPKGEEKTLPTEAP